MSTTRSWLQPVGRGREGETSLLLPSDGIRLSWSYLAAREAGNIFFSQVAMGLCTVSRVMFLTLNVGCDCSLWPRRNSIHSGGKGKEVGKFLVCNQLLTELRSQMLGAKNRSVGG